MKTKNQQNGLIAILAIITLALAALAITACESEKKDPCPCPNGTVHYDTPCACAGIGNDCHCTVAYKPALTDVFDIEASADSIKSNITAAFDEIWISDPQLLLNLATRTGKVVLGYLANGSFEIQYLGNGTIFIKGDIPSDFTDQFKAKLIDARDDTTFA